MTETGAPSAGKQAVRVKHRLGKVRDKINSIEEHRGADVTHLDLLDQLKDEHVAIREAFASEWVAIHERPLESAQQRVQAAKTAAALAVATQHTVAAQEKANIERLQARSLEQIALQTLTDDQERKIDEKIAAARQRVAAAEKSVTDSEAEVEQAQLDVAAIHADYQRTLAVPNRELDRLCERTNALLALATKLYSDIESRSVEVAKGVVESNRSEFTQALAYHRQQADSLNRRMLWTAVAFSVVVFLLFFSSWVERPHTLPKTGVVDWGAVVLVFGGRFAILGAGAGLIVFFGRLHARHAQQAVTYQSRLAALDIASTLLAYSSPAGREDTLKQMSVFYRTHGDNAFAATSDSSISGRSLDRLTRTVARLTKALGGDSGTK